MRKIFVFKGLILKNLNTKIFKQTDDYKDSFKYVNRLVKDKILTYSEKINDHFDNLDEIKLLTPIDAYDFNDKYYLDLCELKNLKNSN